MSLRLAKMGGGTGQRTVVAIKSVSRSPESWSEEKFLPGDVLEHLRLESQCEPLVATPFPGGKARIAKELRKLFNTSEKIYVQIIRQAQRLEISACVVTEDKAVLRKHYALADFADRNHTISLTDALEEDIFQMQEQSQRLLEKQVRAKLSEVQLKDSVIPYAWQQKMQNFLPPPNSAIVFSLLVMPFQPNVADSEFKDVDDTAARGMTWLSASQRTGVPIIFVNIQTEPILRQGSPNKGFGMVSLQDASTLPSSSSYTVHDEAGSDIGILRGVRLWYAPAGSELAFDLIPLENERLGVSISHTQEGFIYVSSVEHGTAADRARLKQLHEAARSAGKLLVISRVAGQKVTPQMVQSSGGIRCFDTLLISQVLSQHKQALQPIQIYVILWGSFSFASLIRSPSTTRIAAAAAAAASAVASATGVRCSFDSSSQGAEWQSNKSSGVQTQSSPTKGGSFRQEQRQLESSSPRHNSPNHCSASNLSAPAAADTSSNENEDFSFSF